MAAKSYALTFNGYWREPNISSLPAKSGVYGVYACTHNTREGTVSLNRLLYIGEAVDVRARVAGHERWTDWKRKLQPGEEICLNAAEISPEADRQRAEAAMIFKHKPPCNTEYVDAFPFDTTTVATSGRNALMQASFTVTRTERVAAPAFGRRW